MNMREQWQLHCTSQWGAVDTIEYVYCVVITFKMTEQVEQQVCIKFFIKLEHSSMETIQMIQKAFGDDAMNAAQISVEQVLQRWSRIFGWKIQSMVERIHILEDLQQAEHLRMLNTYGVQSTTNKD